MDDIHISLRTALDRFIGVVLTKWYAESIEKEITKVLTRFRRNTRWDYPIAFRVRIDEAAGEVIIEPENLYTRCILSFALEEKDAETV